MMNSVNAEVYADISIIIGMMPAEMKEKISKKFIAFVEKNKSNDYVSNINPNVPLNRQDVRKETKELMGIIYRDYLCDADERAKLLVEEAENLELAEKEKRRKYNPDEIFAPKAVAQDVASKPVEAEIAVVQKEKWYQKIFSKIKNLFSKKGKNDKQ